MAANHNILSTIAVSLMVVQPSPTVRNFFADDIKERHVRSRDFHVHTAKMSSASLPLSLPHNGEVEPEKKRQKLQEEPPLSTSSDDQEGR